MCTVVFPEIEFGKFRLVNTLDKPFKCAFCPKLFKFKIQKMNHQRIKHNQSKLKCTWDGCNVEFNTSGHRYKHIQRVHDPTPYHCDECSRKYKLKRELDHHKRKHQIMKTRKMQQKLSL